MTKKLIALSLCAYIGTKSVLATTMTRGEYNDYRGWQIPENENPSEQGYLVEYVDGGKPNDERHAGYISWSPRDVFEKSYHQSQTPQDRVRLEYQELKERRDKLIEFIQKGQPDFIDDKGWALLNEQCDAMNWYYTILGSRIELF
ncbi:hypothetical protein F909_03910 [Acinetobacter sp. ANC 3929]|nr:hypothetical protein F909_03910 [Acinetobacter sp. ANC 3929]